MGPVIISISWIWCDFWPFRFRSSFISEKLFCYLWIFFSISFAPLSSIYKLDPFCFPYIYLIFFLITLFCSFLFSFTWSFKAFFHIPIFSLLVKNYTSTKWFLMVTWACTVYMQDNFINLLIKYLDCLQFSLL